MTPARTNIASPRPFPVGRPTQRDKRLVWAKHRREATRLILAKADWFPILIFASILMTPEARIDLGGFQLYPYRLALFASLPAMMVRVGREPIKFGLVDLLFVFSSSLMLINTSIHYPIEVALKTGAANMLDMLLAYLAGRVFFRSTLDFRKFLYRISPMLMAVAVIMALESISHRYILRPFVGAITGRSPAAALNLMYEIRNGFLRATGPFMHPIAAGLFFGTLAPLYIAADLPKRRWWGLLACLGGIFGWSSAGIASIVVGSLLAVYEQIQRMIRSGWSVVIMAVVVAAVLIEVLTESGLVRFIIRYGAINPITGYFRLMIWEYGSAAVAKSPWIGIGFESYERPAWMHTDSVDNYWLLHALRYGIPSMACMMAGVVWAVIRLGLTKEDPQVGALHGRRLEIGLCISLIVTYFSLISSAPWGADMAWIIILTGAAVGLADKRPAARAGERPAR